MSGRTRLLGYFSRRKEPLDDRLVAWGGLMRRFDAEVSRCRSTLANVNRLARDGVDRGESVRALIQARTDMTRFLKEMRREANSLTEPCRAFVARSQGEHAAAVASFRAEAGELINRLRRRAKALRADSRRASPL